MSSRGAVHGVLPRLRSSPCGGLETGPPQSRGRSLMATAAATLYCGRCGAPLAPGAPYCGRCGTPVLMPTTAPPPGYTYPQASVATHPATGQFKLAPALI